MIKIKVCRSTQMLFCCFAFLTAMAGAMYCIFENSEYFFNNYGKLLAIGGILLFIFCYKVFAMYIKIKDDNLICKGINEKVKVPINKIDFAIKERGFYDKVVVYYNDGYKVILYPENEEELINLINDKRKTS